MRKQWVCGFCGHKGKAGVTRCANCNRTTMTPQAPPEEQTAEELEAELAQAAEELHQRLSKSRVKTFLDKSKAPAPDDTAPEAPQPTAAGEVPESVRAKMDVVMDAMTRVVVGASPGAMIYGPGGSGKSFALRAVMKRYAHKEYIRHDGRVSGPAMFKSLCAYPDAVHVIEDMEDAFSPGPLRNLLRSALWGEKDSQGRRPRHIHWQTARGMDEAIFLGGLVVCANAQVDTSDAVLRAVASRLQPLLYALTDDEMRDMFRYLATEGYVGYVEGRQEMTPAECADVAEHIVTESYKGKMLDMRVWNHACDAYLTDRSGHSRGGWRAAVSSMLQQEVKPDQKRSERRLELAWSAWQLRKIRNVQERNAEFARLSGCKASAAHQQYAKYLRLAKSMNFPIR